MLSSLAGLLFVFGLLGIALWGLRRWGAVTAKGRHLNVVESAALGPGKNLSLVKVGRKCFLLAATNEQISLLAELDPDELTPPREQSPSAEAMAAGRFSGDRALQPAGALREVASRLWNQDRRKDPAAALPPHA